MTILTRADYIAAPKQRILMNKNPSTPVSGSAWMSGFGVAGFPAAGTWSAGNTANGAVPDATVTGYPSINAFGGGAAGYITRLQHWSGVATNTRLRLFDRLFNAGEYTFGGAVNTLASQPSYSARIPGGTDYSGLQIWIECTVLFVTAAPVITVTYTNQAGTAARSTGAVTMPTILTQGTTVQLPLQAGDTGVQTIESVLENGATVSAGKYNVMVLRPLGAPAIGKNVVSGVAGPIWDVVTTGMPQIFATSALYMLNLMSTTSRTAEMLVEISNK